MAVLEILTYPDPFLKTRTRPVIQFDDNLQELLRNMADTMYDAPGVGLAATQIGSDQSIIVFDPTADKENRPYRVLINPKIIAAEGEIISENEGCLSVPEFRSDVKRSEKMLVEGLDGCGAPVKIEAEGLLAIILQHEIDHLNGVLFIDRISTLKREIYKRKVRKQLKTSA
ncbi:MAG: peptide deformylase [Thermodesulfobacteriota bacterium]